MTTQYSSVCAWCGGPIDNDEYAVSTVIDDNSVTVHNECKLRMDFNALPDERRRISEKFTVKAATISPKEAAASEKHAIHLLAQLLLDAAEKEKS